MAFSLFLASLLLLAPSVWSGGSPGDFPCVWTEPPKDTPSVTWPDGPVMGDGNLGVSVGGAPGSITLYITTNGYWGAGNNTNSSVAPLTWEWKASEPAPPLGFPGCPADDCIIPVGLTLAAFTVESPGLTASWGARLDIANGTTVVSLGSSLTATIWVSATAQVAFLTLQAQGADAVLVNVSAWGNGNTVGLPVAAGCNASSPSSSSATPSSPSSSSSASPCGLWVTKDASLRGHTPLMITGTLASKWVRVDAGVIVGAASPYTTTQPHTSWATHKTVPTLTTGAWQPVKLSPGAAAVLAFTAVGSRDAGVFPQDPSVVAASRLSPLTPASIPTLQAAHNAWWANYYSASSISLPSHHADTEGFWWSAIYALGSATRAGQVVSDLWAPFRTTDYSAWRSNPTMDYNQQALYSGVYTANHVDLAGPYYDFIDQALASGGPQLEAAAYGCPGVHLSVDLGPFGFKLGVWGVPADWGILSDAAYAAVNYAYHWESVVQDSPETLAWVEDHAWPFLSGVAQFWACKLTKTPVGSGYEYWDIGDCNGDEGCSVPIAERTNPMWGVVYIRRLFATLASMAAATNRTLPPLWVDIAAHLPLIPVGVYKGEPVLAWYGTSDYFNWGGQSGNLHALWPAELVSLSEPNATLRAAALNTFNYTAWGQDNAFSWVFASAARAGVAPDTILTHWRQSLANNARPNRLVAFGGLCSDSLGAVAYVHDMLVQGQEGFLRLFPAWPANESASFTTLRLKGALLVSASYAGQSQWAGLPAGITGGTVSVSITAEAGGQVSVLSPWPAAAPSALSLTDGGKAVPVTWSSVGGTYGGPLFTFTAAAGHTYIATSTA